MGFDSYPAEKDPNSIVDYGRVWGDNWETGEKGWLGDAEEIDNSQWLISSEAEPTPTLEINGIGVGISDDKKATSVWLEGGTVGVEYNVTNRITTNEHRVEDRTGIITVAEK